MSTVTGHVVAACEILPGWRKFARGALAPGFDRAHPGLLSEFAAVCRYCEDHGEKTPIITHIERWWPQHLRLYSKSWRSAEENLAAARKVPSPHLIGDEFGRRTQPGSRALDMRSHGYPRHFIDELCEHLNLLFPRSDGKKALIFHDVGAGPHWHLQTPYDAQWAKQEKK